MADANTSLSGRRVLITGGNSGIGRATAELFAQHGARVAVSGRDEATLAETRAALPDDALVSKSEVTDEAQLASLFERVVSAFGGLDAVIVNAGVADPRPFDQADRAHFRKTTSINQEGAFFTAQHAAKHLAGNDAGGSITFVSTCLSEMGMAGMSAYAASKAAVRSLVRTLAAELGPAGIRVNAVSPGPIETPIYAKMGMPEEQLAEMAGAIQRRVPLGRFGNAEEVAAALLFVTADSGSFMHGADLAIDGGMGQV